MAGFRYGLGYIQSPEDKRDAILHMTGEALPEKYEVKDLGTIYDQGMEPICAAVCIATILEWKRNARNGGKEGKWIDPHDVYDLREDKTMDGMILRDAIKAVKRTGVDGEFVKSYARIEDPISAKVAIMLNGPIIIGTRTFNDHEFWKPSPGELNIGGHATLLVGFDKEGFTLRNSWGLEYAYGGEITLPYDDWEYVLESWTIIS